MAYSYRFVKFECFGKGNTSLISKTVVAEPDFFERFAFAQRFNKGVAQLVSRLDVVGVQVQFLKAPKRLNAHQHVRNALSADFVEFKADREKMRFVLDHFPEDVKAVILDLVVIEIYLFELSVRHHGLADSSEPPTANRVPLK